MYCYSTACLVLQSTRWDFPAEPQGFPLIRLRSFRKLQSVNPGGGIITGVGEESSTRKRKGQHEEVFEANLRGSLWSTKPEPQFLRNPHTSLLFSGPTPKPKTFHVSCVRGCNMESYVDVCLHDEIFLLAVADFESPKGASTQQVNT